MPPVEAVGMMLFGEGCHLKSTPIREAKPNVSDGRTSLYNFAASFNGANPEEKPIYRSKIMVKIFHDCSQVVNVMTRIK